MISAFVFAARGNPVATVAICLILLGCGTPASRGAPPTPTPRFTYQPYSASYEGVWHGRVEQDLNNRTTVNTFGVRYYLRVDLADSNGGTRTTMILDSIAPAGSAAALPPELSAGSLSGIRFAGSVTPQVRIETLKTDSDSDFAHELAGRLLQSLFPIIPPGGVEPGTTWVDTVAAAYPVSGMQTSVQTIAGNESVGWTTFRGQQVLEVRSLSTYTFSGTGSQFGEEFTIDGSGSRTAHHYLASSGAYLGFVSADTSTAEAYLTSVGVVIPIRQTRADTLTAVP